MSKYLVLLSLLCVAWACNKKDDDMPSKPRYMVLTQTIRYVGEAVEGRAKEYKKVFSYTAQGYENGLVYYEDGVQVEERRDYRHDELGQVAHWETLPVNGSQGGYCDFSYTGSGKPLEECQTFFTVEEGGVVKETDRYKMEYRYNEQDQEIYFFLSSNGKVMFVHDNYKYDSRGELLAFDELDKDGNLLSMFQNTYDESGKRVKSTITAKRASGEYSSVSEYTYDSFGRVISVKNYFEDQYGGRNEDYRYDEAGNLLHFKAYDAEGGLIAEYDYTYQRFEY